MADKTNPAYVAALARLKPRQRRFVEALLADPQRNASAAYKKAGYNGENVESSASRLLNSANIQDTIRTFSAPVAQKLAITVEKIEAEFWAVAGMDHELAASVPGGLSAKVAALKEVAKRHGYYDRPDEGEASGYRYVLTMRRDDDDSDD